MSVIDGVYIAAGLFPSPYIAPSATTGTYGSLTVGTGTFQSLSSTAANIQTLSTSSIQDSGAFSANALSANQMSGVTGNFTNLVSTNAQITNLISSTGSFATLVATGASFSTLTSASATIPTLSSTTATISNVNAGELTVSNSIQEIVGYPSAIGAAGTFYLGAGQATNDSAVLQFNYTATGSANNFARLSLFNQTGLTISGANAVSTAHNTLDSGSGNAVIAGTLTAGNTTTAGLSSAQNVLDDGAGNVFISGLTQSQSVSPYENGWFMLGTLGIPQQGYSARIVIDAGAGYNAAQSQMMSLTLIIRTSNAASVNASGTYLSAYAYRTGYSQAFYQLTLVQNVASASVSYQVWINSAGNVGNSCYTVHPPQGCTWVHSGAPGSSPGANSTTVYNVPYNNQFLDHVTTTQNLLDDGSGNMSVANTLRLTGGSTTTGLVSTNTDGVFLDSQFLNVNFQSGASATNGWCVISNTTKYLLAVSNGGSVNSLHNTLDDGNGNVLINGIGATPLLIMNPAMSNTATTLMIGCANTEYNSGFVQFFTSATGASTNYLRIGVTDAPSALTVNGVGNVSTNSGTVLDDGSGNQTVKGNQTVTGNLTVNGGSLTLNSSDETFSIVTTESGGDDNGYTQFMTSEGGVGYTPFVFNCNSAGTAAKQSRVIITENVGSTGSTSPYAYAANAGALLYVDGNAVVNGALTTSHNTLDNGSGGVSVSSNITMAGSLLQLNTGGAQGAAAGGAPVLTFYGAASTFGSASAGFGLSSNTLECYCYQNFNIWQIDENQTAPAFSVGGVSNGTGTAGLVRTINNVLDNGSGAASVKGTAMDKSKCRPKQNAGEPRVIL